MKPVREVLVAARALIDTPEKWTRGEAARTAVGASVHPRADAAACFCAIGAVRRVVGDDDDVAYLAWEQLARTLPDVGFSFVAAITRRNDKGTHADVLAMFDRAIVACDAEGK